MNTRIILLIYSLGTFSLLGCQSNLNNTLQSHKQKEFIQDDSLCFDSSRYDGELCSLRIDEVTSLPGGVIFLGGNYYGQANTIGTVLLVSRDGGRTWNDAGVKVDGCGIMNFQTAGLSHVWAITTFLNEGCRSPVSLVYSSDAGKSWSSTPLDFMEQIEGLAWIEQFQFFDHQHGLIVIADSRNVKRIYTTDDGGKTWKKQMTSKNNIDDDIEIEPYYPDYRRGNLEKTPVWKKTSDNYYKISGWILFRKTDSWIVIESQSLNSMRWEEVSQIRKYYKNDKDGSIPVVSYGLDE